MQSSRPKSHTESYSSNRKEYAKRSGKQKQSPSSKQASSSTKFWSNPFHCHSCHAQTFQLEESWPMAQWEELTDNKWVLSIVRNGFKIPFKSVPPLSVPINLSQSSSLLLRKEITELLKKRAMERVRNLGTPSFYSPLFLVPKKNRKLSCNRPFLAKSLSRQTTFQEGGSQVDKTIDNG